MRERIIGAAKKLFDEKGLGGVSMRRIAALVGIPTMTLYGYFPSKTAIIRGLWSFAFEPVFAAMRDAEDGIGDPKVRLEKVSKIYVNYWIEYPDRYRMVFLIEDEREGDDPNWFIDETNVTESYMRFAAMIAEAQGNLGEDRKVEAEAWLSALTGIAHMAITVSEYPWSDADAYVDRLLPAFTN